MLHLLRAALEACDIAAAEPAVAAAVPVAEKVAAAAGGPIAATATEPGLDRGPLPKRGRRDASRGTAGSPGRPNGRANGRANGIPAGRDAPLAPVGRRYVETPTITPSIEALVDGHIGAVVGGQGDVLRLCAASGGWGPEVAPADVVNTAHSNSHNNSSGAELRSVGPGGYTWWGGGVAALYLILARGAGRYHNRVWREHRTGYNNGGGGGGNDRAPSRVLVSWYPGRGRSVTDASTLRLLAAAGGERPSRTSAGTTDADVSGDGESGDAGGVLLFARRAPSDSYVLCGRLRAAAIGVPASEFISRSTATRWADLGIATWRMRAGASGAPPPSEAHVVWEIVDADGLLDDPATVRALFGNGGIAPTAADYYEAERD